MILRTVGRFFIAAGVLVLLFLAYQLFGTNFVTERHQQALTKQLERAWAAPAPAPSPSPATGTTPPPQDAPAPDPGRGIAIIEIPKIDVRRVVVEGIGVDDLKKGPGHYPDTAYPGEKGNAVISGHRTTYGAPFYRLDELRVGDEIQLTTQTALHVYKVTETKIVPPTDLSVITSSEESKLTLTTCNPRFSARQRLIVVGELVSSKSRAEAA